MTFLPVTVDGDMAILSFGWVRLSHAKANRVSDGEYLAGLRPEEITGDETGGRGSTLPGDPDRDAAGRAPRPAAVRGGSHRWLVALVVRSANGVHRAVHASVCGPAVRRCAAPARVRSRLRRQPHSRNRLA